MNSLTLNYAITQLRLRCRVLPAGIKYEAMISNHWQPVTHKFVEILWAFLYTKKNALVKINSLNYIGKTLAKSNVKLGSLDSEHGHCRSYCGFFVHNIQIHLFYGGLGGGAERLAGCVYNRYCEPRSVHLHKFRSFGGELLKLIHEGCLMTTIPNQVVLVDDINKKLHEFLSNLNLAKIDSVGHIDIALAKSSVRIGTLQLPMATHDAQSVFFCVNACAHLHFISMVALAGHPKGWLFSIGSSSSNPVNVTANEIGTSCGYYINYPTEAVSKTTIPNQIAFVTSKEVI